MQLDAVKTIGFVVGVAHEVDVAAAVANVVSMVGHAFEATGALAAADTTVVENADWLGWAAAALPADGVVEAGPGAEEVVAEHGCGVTAWVALVDVIGYAEDVVGACAVGA